MLKKVFVFFVLACSTLVLNAQDSIQGSSFSMNADFVSRYVWRGQLYSAAPNIQPYASFTSGQFTFGTWGSYGIGESYAEVDFYLTWQYKNFGLTLSDYCTLSETIGETKYFNFKDSETPHALEGTASFQISEAFPLTLTAATFFYGNDRDSTGKYYSTYFELKYPFTKGEYEFDIYAGGTPKEGLYGTKAGLVNVGLSARKNIRFSESFEIPACIQLSANPVANYFFLVFGLTI